MVELPSKGASTTANDGRTTVQRCLNYHQCNIIYATASAQCWNAVTAPSTRGTLASCCSKWCRKFKNWTTDQWRRFSPMECSSHEEMVLLIPADRYKPKSLQAMLKLPESVMIWI
ncbi:hypothetical protein LSAT2_023854 [Lamellibrachia satsuma]|nr:hypothetical protein LSAT2_023854 [Lamellibrachia satsuma]